jgi:alpha-tubulin suppressor-like RCC1 family protein
MLSLTAAAATPSVDVTPKAASLQFTQLAASYGDTCGVTTSLAVSCWGWNQSGQLGNGSTTTVNHPSAVVGLGASRQVSLGHSHSCALLVSGMVACWGQNQYGQLGIGTTTNSSTPVTIPGLTSVRQVALGSGHSCALLTSGTVRCWGWNKYGQLGNGSTTNQKRPVAVSGLSGVQEIALGYGSTCALLTSGNVKCWGWNSHGQLGIGTTSDKKTPTSVPGISGVTHIALGYAHGCALMTSGTIACWGWNQNGQLGIGTKVDSRHPIAVTGLSGVRQIALGIAHSCALLTSGGVRCWGSNQFGQLGTGTTTSTTTPAVTQRLVGVTQIASGDYSSCALLASKAYSCWGWNAYGQLGNGANANVLTPPFVPGAPTNVLASGPAVAVSWSPPSSNGGSAITSYTLTAADSTTPANGGQTCTWSTGPLTCTLLGLTNGDSYSFTVTATNALGTGPASSPSPSVTPATIPGGPTGVVASPGNESAAVSWSAPGSDGGSAITSYTAAAADSTTPANGGQTCSWSTGPLTCTVSGLTNGDSYTFTVTATNLVGTGIPSSPSPSVTPATVPDAPTGVLATPGNGSATVTWSAPASDGGSAITSFTVTAADSTTPANGGQTCSWSTGPLTCTVSGLTNGDSYSFTVTATNGVGTGPASSPSSSVTPATVPDAPTGVLATPGNASARVSWSAPGSDGGSVITSYTITAADSTTPANGGQTCTWSTGPLTCKVSELTNGDSYSFTVTATNGVGTGAASSPSSSVTPATVPDAPTGVLANPGNGSATVTWSAPASDGGSAITSFTLTAADSTTPANGGQTCSWSTGPLTCTVSGLTNGDSYTFTVTATNGVGTGPASSPSSSVTPATVPDAPTGVLATPGNGSATVTWSAPGSDGGSAITSYTAAAADSTTPANGGQTCTWSTGPLTCTVSGLTNGDSYSFTVTATNGVGTGPASSRSSSVTPATVPDAPTGVLATPGDGSADVTWSASGSDGGSKITSYTVTAADSTTPANGGQTCSGSPGVQHTCTVLGLTNGDSYTFTVTATNGVGTGPASSPSPSVTPSAFPGAPTGVTALVGNSVVILSWTAPASQRRTTIISYTATATDSTNPANGGETCTSTALKPPPRSTCTVSGLTNGETYTFTVTATNAAGTGPASAPSSPVAPAPVPFPPTGVAASPGNMSAIVSWTAPGDDGGSSITSYTVTATDDSTSANGGQTCVWSTGPLTCTVPGLTNGDLYSFTVTATNAVGTGLPSDPSNAVVPATVPSAPSGVVASPGSASATVTWSAPASNGGDQITGYTVTAADSTNLANGGETCTWTLSKLRPPLSCTVTGLTNGDSYTFTVTATNAVGTGPASTASPPVTPS